jgi:hypothetical protein
VGSGSGDGRDEMSAGVWNRRGIEAGSPARAIGSDAGSGTTGRACCLLRSAEEAAC